MTPDDALYRFRCARSPSPRNSAASAPPAACSASTARPAAAGRPAPSAAGSACCARASAAARACPTPPARSPSSACRLRARPPRLRPGPCRAGRRTRPASRRGGGAAAARRARPPNPENWCHSPPEGRWRGSTSPRPTLGRMHVMPGNPTARRASALAHRVAADLAARGWELRAVSTWRDRTRFHVSTSCAMPCPPTGPDVPEASSAARAGCVALTLALSRGRERGPERAGERGGFALLPRAGRGAERR